MDERLRRIQRLDAVGRMSVGVAHDFNNVLTVVQGEAEMLLGGEHLSSDLEEGLRHIQVAAEQGVELTGRLLSLGRGRDLSLKRHDLNEIARRFVPMLERLVKQSCTVELELCPSPALLDADERMLERVLMNLVMNAADAMREGGGVGLSTSLAAVDEETAARYPDAHSGRYVRLSVTDTGTGIPPGDLPQIFEPLFTTKEEGQGTGLGLATVYSIVRQHGGWMDVESELGRGSTFHAYLPTASFDSATGP